MNSIRPNKEIIRRICLLNGGTTCYISHTKGDDFIEVAADIEKNQLINFAIELKEWSGMNYKTYHIDNSTTKEDLLQHINEKILPITTL